MLLRMTSTEAAILSGGMRARRLKFSEGAVIGLRDITLRFLTNRLPRTAAILRHLSYEKVGVDNRFMTDCIQVNEKLSYG